MNPTADPTGTPVQAGWDNHFAAFGGQNLSGILQDYTETSILNIYDAGSGVQRQYVGLSEIEDAFAALFAQLTDLSGLAAPVVEVDEEREEVFLVWECPSSGIRKATDTFSFVGNKIMAQTFAIYPTDGATPVQPVGLTIGSPMTGDTGNGGIVDSAIDHHYGAFFGADLAATLVDYADNIEFNTHDLRTGVTTTCTGMDCVRNSFAPLYDMDRSVIALDFTNTNEADAATGAVLKALLGMNTGDMSSSYSVTYSDTGLVGLMGATEPTAAGAMVESFVGAFKAAASVDEATFTLAKTAAKTNAFIAMEDGLPLEIANIDGVTSASLKSAVAAMLKASPALAAVGPSAAVPSYPALTSMLK